jgi:hypothetical protein
MAGVDVQVAADTQPSVWLFHSSLTGRSTGVCSPEPCPSSLAVTHQATRPKQMTRASAPANWTVLVAQPFGSLAGLGTSGLVSPSDRAAARAESLR